MSEKREPRPRRNGALLWGEMERDMAYPPRIVKEKRGKDEECEKTPSGKIILTSYGNMIRTSHRDIGLVMPLEDWHIY